MMSKNFSLKTTNLKSYPIQSVVKRLTVLVVVLLMSACSGGGDDCSICNNSKPIEEPKAFYTKVVDTSKIVTDPSTGASFPVNRLIISYADNITKDEKQNLLNSVNASEVGFMKIGDFSLYQIEIPVTSVAELENIVAKLEANPKTDFVIKNFIATTMSPATPDTFSDNLTPEQQKPYHNIKLSEAWKRIDEYLNGTKPKEVIIAAVDSGLDKSNDDFRGLTNIGGVESDFQSHGTSVSGIIAAANNGKGMNGIMTGIQNTNFKFYMNVNTSSFNLIADKVSPVTFPFDLFTVKSNIIQGILSNAQIINLSIGWGKNVVKDKAFSKISKMFESLFLQYPHVLFVCAAGNDGVNAESYTPGGNLLSSSIKNRIVVGATQGDKDVETAVYPYPENAGSNWGDTVDIAAPGSSKSITTTCPSGSDKCNIQGMWMSTFGGTSAATPFVTGVAGLMLYIDDSLTPSEIKEILQSTGDDIVEGKLVGKKRINADGAVEKVIKKMTSKPSTVSNLEMPSEVNVNTPFNIRFQYDDPNGISDIKLLVIESSDPAQSAMSFEDADLSKQLDLNAKGLAYKFGSIGEYWIKVYAIDKDGNQSNELQKTVKVVSPQSTYTLTISETGTGNGTTMIDDVGTVCDKCSYNYSYPQGKQLKLSAAPADDSTFAGWSGGGCSGTGDCVIAMNSDVTVTATFNLKSVVPPSYTLTVSESGTGNGIIRANDINEIWCGDKCSYSYPQGTQVRIYAITNENIADEDSTFAGWSGGGCSGTGDCVVTMNSDVTVTATFNLKPSVTWYKDADQDKHSDGTTKISPTRPGNDYYPASELTATSGDYNDNNAGIHPGATEICGNGIDEDCNGSDSACEASNYKLTIAKSGTGNGIIVDNFNAIGCGDTCSDSYPKGTQVTLSLIPNENSTFAGWSGGGCSGTGDCVVTMNSDATVTATFNLKPSNDFSNDLGMTFKLIPNGTFTMGSPTGEPGRDNDETLHQVTLTKSFYMQTTEVTQGQWKAMMGSNPSRFSDCGDTCPVEKVSWNDAQAFIAKMNQRGEGTYRLPTEAEWEYAARAGTTTAYNWGSSDDCSKANYGNGVMSSECKNKNPDKTMKVGSFDPNAWGLYDMHGNVAEWCQDFYGDYPSGSVTDPPGPSHSTVPQTSFTSASKSYRVLRSGNYYEGGFSGIGDGVRSAARDYDDIDHRGAAGFRLVRNN